MTPDEQDRFLSAEYAEANRYMDNAEEILVKAKEQDYGYYKDEKYVRIASGTAYLAVLIALDAWLTMKEVQIPKKRNHTNIDFYLTQVAKLDKKMLERLNAVYNVLHLDGYYRKVKNVDIIRGGFKVAYSIIEKIKPEHFIDIPETRRDRVKRAWNKMVLSVAAIFRL